MEEKIYDMLPENQISLDIKSRTKNEVLKEIVELLESSPYILKKDELLDNLIERERLETTGIGDGIALPHARTDSVSQLVIGFGRSEQGIEYDSLDGNLVHILFFIAAPKTSSTKVLKVLAKISRLLNNENFRKELIAAKTKKEIRELIKTREE
jgi:fructose-specific phosphotransferase system IIA component